MRQVANGKRSRGRPGRNKPSNPRNNTFDSNGPEGRVRGSANQVFEKYLALARDAQSSGDRIMAENLFQHAEHYFRIMNANANGGMNGNGNGQPGRNRMYPGSYGNTSDEFEDQAETEDNAALDPASQPQPSSPPQPSPVHEPTRVREPTSPAELAAAAAGNRADDTRDKPSDDSPSPRGRRGRKPRNAQDDNTSDSPTA